MFNVGDKVGYHGKKNPCVVIATKDEPHKYRYGVKDIDDLGFVRPVPENSDYTIVETNVEFSPYIDVIQGEITPL